MKKLYKELIPNNKKLIICSKCQEKLVVDIFQMSKEEMIQRKAPGRLFEAKVCENCKIIYARLD